MDNRIKPITIYLAGYINNEVIDECRIWRKQIRNHYDNWKNAGHPYPVIWLDPMNGEGDCKISNNGLKSSIHPHSIVHRDYQCILKSDLIIANMNTFGKDRPPIGTICEVAWAFDHHKPIILITNSQNYKEHPFLSYFSSWTVESVDELLEKKIINFYFKGWSSAIY